MRLTVLVLGLTTVCAASDLTWELDGYPRILKAAEQARAEKRRILIGMSGAPS